LARVMGDIYFHSQLDSLFYEYDLEIGNSFDNKLKRSIRFLRMIEANYDVREANNIILEVTVKILSFLDELNNKPIDYDSLLSNLRIDGFDFTEGQLLPTTPSPASLAPELSALQNKLKEQGLRTAHKHYNQAIENYIRGNWESCNGQLRCFLEDFLLGIGKDLTGTARTDPVSSIQDLKTAGYLDHAEFNQFKSFWSGIQDNGPHRGLSNEQEALFRLHVSTSIARYLIFKLPLIK